MNTRAKMILMAVAAASATAALNSQAADQSAWFEQQREMTDGGPTSTVVPTPARTRPATPHQLAEVKWFDAERTREGGVAQYPFPLPENDAVAAAAVPTVTPAENVVAAGRASSQVRQRTDAGRDPP